MTTPSSVVSTLGRSSTAECRGSSSAAGGPLSTTTGGVPEANPGMTSPSKNPPGKTTGLPRANGPSKG